MKPNRRETHFLGWEAPLLPGAAHFLCDRGLAASSIDLRGMVCVLPTSLAVGKLQKFLRDAASGRGLPIELPAVLTVGALPGQLFRPPLPLASELEQTLAWAAAIQQTGAADLRPLIPSAVDSLRARIDLGSVLRSLHEDLAANRRSFADVAAAATTDSERRRWQILEQLDQRYRAALIAAGMTDPHAALSEAIAAAAVHCDRTIVLVGTTDLTPVAAAALAALDSPVIALIAAPPESADKFDSFGTVISSAWLDYQLPLSDDQLIPAGDIADQAQAVAETVHAIANRFPLERLTVGVTDESQVAPVEVELRGWGVPTYRQLGWTIRDSGVGRLLDLTVAYLNHASWPALAALVRQGDVDAWLQRELGDSHDDWLTPLDQLLSQYLPVDPHTPLPMEAAREGRAVVDLVAALDRLLSRFRGAPQGLRTWSAVLQDYLDEVVIAAPDTAFRTTAALATARGVLSEFSQLNPQLDSPLGGPEAVEMLAERLSQMRFGSPDDTGAVPIIGWLDLPLDDAPALVVTGLNQPFVPDAVTGDPFLPGTLRSQLRMADNDRRLARDIHAMQLMLGSRLELRFIVGRTSADGSPTPPSRLLSAAAPLDSARRVRRLLASDRPPAANHHRWQAGPPRTELTLPMIDPTAGPWPIKTIGVTAFRDYLICPYRFYLRHVLKIRPLDDSASELAANQFGDLVHDTLERFAHSEDRDEADAARIEQRLTELLLQLAEQRYGNPCAAAVALQVAQANKRLAVVAQRQAERIAAGWRIQGAELEVNEQRGARIEVDGEPMFIRGRIDRVDFHPETGRWAILDYKTHGDPPAKKHLKPSRVEQPWVDLQLPLYRRLAPCLGITVEAGEIELGYFNIGQTEAETRINLADFDDALLAQADDLIEQIIRDIRAGRFQPTTEPVPYDDYDMILSALSVR